MNVLKMLGLELRVHNCVKCKKEGFSDFLPYPPVYSFGNPAEKKIIVVGQNPSSREYITGFLSKSPDIEERRMFQLSYFDRRNYAFFKKLEKFFDGQVKEIISWKKSPWEKVGYLDIVKCPTKAADVRGQWSKIPPRVQEAIVNNCQDYLKEQLQMYMPLVVIAYGADVGRWFSQYVQVTYKEFENKKAQLNGKNIHILFVPQRQNPHSQPEITWVQNKIVSMLNE